MALNHSQTVAVAHHLATVLNRPKVSLREVPKVLETLSRGLLEGVTYTHDAQTDSIDLWVDSTNRVTVVYDCRNGALIPAWYVED